MDEIRVFVLRGEGASLPEYKTHGAAGADLRAAIDEAVFLEPFGRAAVPTGLRIELPEGYEAQVRPRSGLALEKGITCLNSPGTVDCDFRGEIKVILVNLGGERVTIKPGARIAQLVVAPDARAHNEERGELSVSIRGEGGFGSTGV